MYRTDGHGIIDNDGGRYCVAYTIEAAERICRLLNLDEAEKAVARKTMGIEVEE